MSELNPTDSLSNAAFQSQLQLMDGLDSSPIQFACDAVEHANRAGTAGEMLLVFSEVSELSLPKRVAFTSVTTLQS